MLVEFKRKGARRLIDQYDWSEETGYVCDVTDPDLLSELFTNPAYDDDFAVHSTEPLVAVLGNPHDVQVMVVYAGITSVEMLADLTEDGASRLMSALLATKRTVKSWIAAARSARQKKYQVEDTAVPPEQAMEVS